MSTQNRSDANTSNADRGPATSIPIIFILSTGHAGGTLLNFLLGVSDRIVAVGESLRTENLRRINDQSPSAQAFWTSVLTKMEARGWSGAEILDESERSVYFWKDWFLSIESAAESRILADKTPSLELVQTIVAGLPCLNPFFIHLVRDPRAVCFSYMKKQSPMLPQIYTWVQSHRAIEKYLEGKQNSVSLNYEDLAHAPAGVLTWLFDRIGRHYGLDLTGDVPPDLAERRLDDPIFDNVIFAGNRMRHAENRHGKAIEPDEKFRTEMSEWKWRVISALCSGQLKRYGYIPERRAAVQKT